MNEERNKPTVTAVIVTYNRLDLLKDLVPAVLAQTRKPDSTIIVNNKSTDGTGEWLEKVAKQGESVRILNLEENLGASGGYHYGIKAAYESGAQWIWTMDDDTLPHPDALEQLLVPIKNLSSADLSNIGFLASTVLWKDGSRHTHNVPVPTKFWWDGYDVIPGSVRLAAATFVSLLIHRKAVEAVGYPVKEFFIWWDDVEYTVRMSDSGFWGYHVEESKVIHLTSTNRTSESMWITEENVWKHRYGFRNEIAVAKAQDFGPVLALWRIATRVGKMYVHKIPRRLMFEVFLSGLRGYAFNYRKYIFKPEHFGSDKEKKSEAGP